MTNSLFRITPTPPTSIKLEPGQEGRFSFTVVSLAAPGKTHEVILQALRVGEGGKGEEADWLVPGPTQTLSMSGGETQTVTITARPKPASPRGESKIQLVIADKDKPNDVFADAPTVVCEVLGPSVVTTPTKKLPWWLIPAIVGGVLVVGGAILLVVKLSGSKPSGTTTDALPGLGQTCGTEAGKVCAEGLVCETTSNTCQKPKQTPPGCTSGTRQCTADRRGIDTCDNGTRRTESCPANTTCDPATGTCKGSCADGPTTTPPPGWETAHAAQQADKTSNFGPAVDSKQTGSPASNGGANIDGTELIVGDEQFLGGTTNNDLVSQGAITFDLPGIPQTAKIVSATLQLFQTRTLGSAYQAPLSQVVIEHARFASAFDADQSTPINDTLGTGRTVLSANRNVELKAVDVTLALRWELATCRTQAQFRLRFAPAMTVPNAREDSARFASDNSPTNKPLLVVRWRP